MCEFVLRNIMAAVVVPLAPYTPHKSPQIELFDVCKRTQIRTLFRIHSWLIRERILERFHSRVQNLCKCIGKRESVYIRKEHLK